MTEPRHENSATLQERFGRLAVIVLLLGTIAVELVALVISWSHRFPLNDWITLFWLPYLVGLVYLGIGIWVFRHGEDHRPAQSFVLLSLFMALVTGTLFDLNTSQVFSRVWIAALPLAGAALVHLGLVFPEEAPLSQRWPWLRAIPYPVGLVLVVIAQWMLGGARDPWTAITSMPWMYVALALAIAAFFALLLYTRSRTVSAVVRQQLRIVVLGSLLAFAPLFGYLVLSSLGFKVTFYTTLYLPTLVIFPLTISYAILRYRLLSMDLFMSRGLAYAILIAAVAGAYAEVLIVLGQALGLDIIRSYPLLMALFIAILILVLNPLREGAERLADRLLGQRHVDYRQALQDFSRTLATTPLELPTILKKLLGQIEPVAHSAPALIFLHDARLSRYTLTQASGFAKPEGAEISFEQDSALVRWLDDQDRPIYMPDDKGQLPSERLSAEEKGALDSLGLDLYLPLRGERSAADRLRGWVALGPRLSGEPYSPDDLAFLAALVDQTAIAVENAQLLDEAHRRADELIALQQTALDVSGQQAIPVLLQSIVERAARLLDATGGSVFLSEGTESLRLVASHNLGADYAGVLLNKGEGVAGQVLLHGNPVRVENYEQFPERAQALAGAQARSVLGVPLKWRDQVLGVLDVADTSLGRRFTKEDEWLLSLFASQAAIALRNAQLFAALEQRVNQLDALRQIGEAVDLRQELDTLLNLIYQQTARVLEVDNYYVALYDPMRQDFRMAFYIEEGEERIPSNPTWPLGTGLTSQIVQSGEPIVTDDYVGECERRGVPSSGRPARAWLGVPLVTGPEGHVLGVLNVSSFRPDSAYSPEQVELMCTLADQAAVAIDRMHLYQAMQDRAAELATLNEVSRAVSSTLDLEGIPGLIMKKVVDLLAVEAGSLLLVDEEVGDLVFKVALRGEEYEFLVGRRHPMGQGIVGCVAQTGESQIVNDAQTDPRWDNKVDQDTGFVTETILCVPMISRDKVIGVIEVINHCDGRPFTENEAWLLEAFAAQAAIAIENARLYTQTDQALAHRVEELSTMQRIDRELNATLDFDHIMDMTLEWALRGTGAPAGIIAFHDEEQQGLLLLASQGYPPEFEDYRREPWPLGESAVGQVVQSGKPVLVPDASQEPDSEPIQPDSRSQLFAPILREDRVIGAVILESPQPSAFNQDALSFVQRLADHAAIAIENARLYQDVKLANQAKSEFIDFVAHELKQPMTAMQGYAKMLTMGIGGELTDTQNQFVEVITSNVDRMGKLVNDLLEISRLEAGRTKLKLSPVQLKDVVEETVTNVRAELEARHHSLVVEAPESLPLVLGDRERLAQILSNLVSNAYKYTPEGGTIRIVIEGQEYPEVPPGTLRVQVSDTGIGMTEQDMDKLEEKFFRGDHDLVQAQPGTGLGVSITRNLVELHGGEFSVESEPDQGSTFAFTVPLAEELGTG